MKINIIVCDDEADALKTNCTYIEEYAKKYKIDINLNSFTNSEKVIDFADNNDIDMAFLDINIKKTNGIALAAKLMKKNPRIVTVFITVHKELAYDAFTVDAFNFLTKPVDTERFERIFKKAVMLVNDMNNRPQRTPLIITEDNIKKKISQPSIIYIKRVNAQSVIVTKTLKHFIYETITSLIERLEENFIQINQGIIVNLEEISDLKGNQITMKTGELFPIGRTYGKEVKKKYLEYPRV